MTARVLMRIGDLEVVAVRWWSGLQIRPLLPCQDRASAVGVVVIRVDPPDALKAYIGVCYESSCSERSDIAAIAHGGVRVNDLAVLHGLFPHLRGEDWYPG